MSAHTVTAVVVAHDGARWLPETLQALRSQTRAPDRIVAVDNGSQDDSGELLTQVASAVHRLPRSTGFGEAVAHALLHAERTEWIWLLHDDCEPEPETLEYLLDAVQGTARAAVAGPKVRDWHDRRLLVEVGMSVDKAGRRDTGLEAREYDQGQHDGTRDVLAVGTACMLIRRAVWDELGGFDPELPLFRDDLDLCWRANAAGHRVLVVPEAVAYHAEASARRRRRISAAGDHPRRVDRRNAMYVLAANLPGAALVWSLLRNTVGSLLRTLLFLLGKQPANALDEIVALGSVLGSPLKIIRARGRRTRSYAAFKRFLPPAGQTTRRLVEMVHSYLSGSGPVDSAGRHHAVIGGPREEGEEYLTDSGLIQRIFTNPGVLLAAALLAVTLVAERSVLGGGHIGGGALIPVLGGASDLWEQYFAGFHPIGIGTDAGAPPYVAVIALLSTLLFGKPWLAVAVLLLGSVPLAGIFAFIAARRVIPYRPAQLWLAASYALLPVATGAIASGRLGTAVIFALLPLYALLAAAMVSPSPRRARRTAWGLGLLLAVGTAFAPLVWIIALVFGGLTALAFGGVRPGLGRSLAVALGAPLVLLLPWLVQVVLHPSRFLLEAGLHRAELVDARLPAESLLLLSPGGPGMPPVWVTSGLLFAALVALLLRRQRLIIAAGWGLAVFGVLVAILVSRVKVAPISGGEALAPWPGVPLAFAATGILVAAAVSAHRIAELRAAGGLRRLVATVVAMIAVAAPLLAAGAWVINGVKGPLNRDNAEVAPAYVAAAAREGTRPRALVLKPGADQVAYTILRGRSPRLGESDIPVDADVRRRLDVAVAGLASGRGGDDGRVLAGFGVQYVVMAPVDPVLQRNLDSLPWLVRMGVTETQGLWRLTYSAARLTILEAGGKSTTLPAGRVAAAAVIAPGKGARTLVLAEPADDGWQARLDGQELTPKTVNGWAQGWEVPAEGGRLELSRGELWRHAWVFVQGALAILVLVWALPGAQTEDELEAAKAPPAAEPAPPVRRSRGHRGRRAKTRGGPPEPDATGGGRTASGGSHARPRHAGSPR